MIKEILRYYKYNYKKKRIWRLIYYYFKLFRYGNDKNNPKSDIMTIVKDFSLKEKITSWVFYSKVNSKLVLLTLRFIIIFIKLLFNTLSYYSNKRILNQDMSWIMTMRNAFKEGKECQYLGFDANNKKDVFSWRPSR